MKFNKQLLVKNINRILIEKSIKITHIEKDIGVSQGYVSRLITQNKNSRYQIIDLLLYLYEHYNVSITKLLTTDMGKNY